MANTEPHVDSAGGSGEVMDRWKTDNCESGGDRLSSRSTSLSRRLIGLAGVAALTVGGAGAVLLGAGAAYATTTTLTSNPYTVGTNAISGLTVNLSSNVAGANSVDTFTFTATDGIAAGTGAITINFANGASSASPAISVADLTAGGSQVVTGTDSATGLAVNLTSAIPSGDQVKVVVAEKNTANTGPYSVSASTNNDQLTVAAATGFTIVAGASSVTPSDSVSSTASGVGGVTLTLGTFGISDITTTATTALPTGSQLTISETGASFASSSYAIVDTPVSGSATSQTPTVKVGTNAVTLTTVAPLNVGDTITITASGAVTNPPTGTETPSIAITAGTDSWIVVDPGTANAATNTAATFPSITYGTTATAISGLSIGASPSTVQATSTYTVNFVATSGLASGGSVTITLAPGTTVGNTLFVLDTTSGVNLDSSASIVSSMGTGSGTDNVAKVTLSTAVSSGDSLEIQLVGSTNPSVVATDTGTVTTTSDSVTASANYGITASTTVAPTVSLSSVALSGVSNYTISDIEAASAFLPGVASTPGQIGIFLPQGSVLPTSTSDYTITDLTNPGASGAPATVVADTSNSPYVGVDLTVSKSVAQNDQLQIVIDAVINPSSPGSNFTAKFFGLSSVNSAVVAPTVPTAATTYPNGAFVQSGGQIDVIAGGVGFGIPTFNDYQQIAASDSSSVVSGSFPTGTAVRTGTLLKVLGSPAIYVVGTNGDAYPFSTPTEFASDGYSAMSVVNVPSLGSLTVGSGAAPTAAVTMPDGALVQSGSTIYVYAGGKAFGIPTFADYQTIAAATGTQVVMGTVSNTAATSLTAGTLIQPIGSAGIWVSDGTSIYQFSTASQFASDGYNGANVVPVPNATGLTQA